MGRSDYHTVTAAQADRMAEAAREGKSSFFKAGHDWLVLTPGHRTGAMWRVTVTKADGSTCEVLSTGVHKHSARNGVSYTVIRYRRVPTMQEQLDQVIAAERAHGPSISAGSRSHCAECGSRRGTMSVVSDSSGRLGWCCPGCARDEAVERSFG